MKAPDEMLKRSMSPVPPASETYAVAPLLEVVMVVGSKLEDPV